MAIRVQCGGCGLVMNVKDEMGGRSGKCPKCGAAISIPAAAPPAPPPLDAGVSPAPPPLTSGRSQSTAFILSWLLGGFGVDRFYLGYTGLGVLKLVTLGGCGIWSIIDFVITGIGHMKDVDGRPLQEDRPVGTPTKDRTVAFVLSWLLGWFGVDRFYLGYTGLGVLKLVTFGGCGLWAIIDFVLTGMGVMKDAQGNSLLKK